MDPIVLIGALSALIELAPRQLFDQYSVLRQSYGHLVAIGISLVRPNIATQYERVETLILRGEDEPALAFRQAVMDECNMNAVAVSCSLVVYIKFPSGSNRMLLAGCHYCPSRNNRPLTAKSERYPLVGPSMPALCCRVRLPDCLLQLRLTTHHWTALLARIDQGLVESSLGRKHENGFFGCHLHTLRSFRHDESLHL